MDAREYCVDIMTNRYNTVLYTGVTNNLIRRVFEHKQHYVPGFITKYRIIKLVYFEVTPDVKVAIQREKQIKAGSRKKKIDLINSINPEWRDLSEDL